MTTICPRCREDAEQLSLCGGEHCAQCIRGCIWCQRDLYADEPQWWEASA